MIENLSFVLIGLSAVVAALTFAGALVHRFLCRTSRRRAARSPLGSSWVGSRWGCIRRSATSMSVRLSARRPSRIWRERHGEFDVHVSPARVDYKACHKGAVEADAKAKQVSVEQNDPSLYAPVDPALIETRCMGQAQNRCTVSCFESR